MVPQGTPPRAASSDNTDLTETASTHNTASGVLLADGGQPVGYQVYSEQSVLKYPDSEWPAVEYTETFSTVLNTFASGHAIPLSIIKLGLLTDQLSPVQEAFEVDITVDPVSDTQAAVVPTETLSAVRWLLTKLRTELSDETKQLVGDLCETAGLTQSPDGTVSFDSARESEYTQTSPSLLFNKTVNSNRNNNSESTANEYRKNSKRNASLASGKRITTRGGERITGKNPLADTSKLKDAGLHQGGG